MTPTIVNRRDLEFQLFEHLDTEALTGRPRFADHSRETFLAALDTAEAIAVEKFAPHNRAADEHEPQFDGERVVMIPEVKEAVPRQAPGLPLLLPLGTAQDPGPAHPAARAGTHLPGDAGRMVLRTA